MDSTNQIQDERPVLVQEPSTEEVLMRFGRGLFYAGLVLVGAGLGCAAVALIAEAVGDGEDDEADA